MKQALNIEYRILNITIMLLVMVFAFVPYSIFNIPYSGIAFAATLSLDPPSGEYGPGDTLVLTVRLDPDQDECINAVSVELKYPSDWMKASAVSKGESVLTLWPEEPKVDIEQGIVNFEGGIPAGYCGRVQGDPGKTNILAKIIFSIPGNMIGGKAVSESIPLSVVFSPNTRVLLNDGFGTPAPIITENGAYTRVLNPKASTNEWLDLVRADNISPDLFTVSVERDTQTYQGKYFIVFSTVDKQSGVHHYEVTEDDPNRFGFILGKSEQALFINATSPYLLKDQTLQSRIIVRVFDHAGNVQETMVSPKNKSVGLSETENKGGGHMLWWIMFGIVALSLLGLGVWLRIRSIQKNDMPPQALE